MIRRLPLVPLYVTGFWLGVGIGAVWDISEALAGIYVRRQWRRRG